MKKALISFVSVIVLLSMVLTGTAMTSTAVSEDPADSYTKQTAENEDSTLGMWFQHSFVKTARGDNTSTGRDTYSIYMAKNEIESAQVVLHSDTAEGHKGLTVSLTDFTNDNGDVIPSEVYRQFYITLNGVNTDNVIADGDIIRTGIDQPDAVMANTEDGAFDIAAGMTQAFLLRLKTSSDTPSGWYSAQFNVYKSPVTDGVIDRNTKENVKTATVYAYVWNFEIDEKTEYETSMYIAATNDTLYKTYYDYMLENRICGMQVPGTLNAQNEYIHNPRVNAFCVTNPGAYPSNNSITQAEIAALYEEFSALDNWDEIKEKAYFYFDDEPMSKEQQDALGHSDGKTVDSVKNSYNIISKAWENPYIVVPYHENHPYPYYGYGTDTMASLFASGAAIKDGTQEMFDTGSVTLWCPKNNAFTPVSELKAINYEGTGSDLIRNLDCSISGMILNGERYFDWSQKYGEFDERIHSYVDSANAAGHPTKLWWYLAGRAGGYTYANHLIDNTGLQTKMYFWQTYQVGATGYLYYGANHWTENTTTPVTMTETYYNLSTGKQSTLTVNYLVNRLHQNNGYVHGNGVLFYDNKVAAVLARASTGQRGPQVAGTLRVEIMRDGIEDYQMLKMYETAAGEAAAQAFVSKISDNVVNYASLNNFSLDGHGWEAGMTADDAVAKNRVDLGNALEKEIGGDTPVPEYTPGDVNSDGKINLVDILMTKRSIAGKTELSEAGKLAADVSKDGSISLNDVTMMKRYFVGKLDTLG